MSNHIDLTIADLELARNRADLLIQSLREFQSAIVTTATPADPMPAIEERVVSVLPGGALIEESRRAINAPRGIAIKGRGEIRKRGKGAGGKGGNVEVAVLAGAAAKIREPFCIQDLAAAAGCKRKQAENFVRNRLGKQIFTKTGRDLYQRGPNFQNAAEAKPAAPDFIVGKGRVLPRNGQVKPPTPPAQSPAGSIRLAADKPTTVVGAMKFLLRDEPSPFTAEEVRESLARDKDWKALLETEVGERSFVQALNNWKFNGYLTREGDTFKVTPAGKEWMNQ